MNQLRVVTLFVSVLSGATLPGCASAPPAGTDPRLVHAAQLTADVQLAVQIVTILHDTPGTFQASDHDLALTKDFAATAGAGIQAYKDGKGSLSVVSTAFHALLGGLSADLKLNDRVKFVLTLVDSALSVVVGSGVAGAP